MMSTISPQVIYLLSPLSYERIYGDDERASVVRLLGGVPPFVDARLWHEHPDLYERTEVILSGWGMAEMDEDFLRSFPSLKLVLYGAGETKGFVTEAFWKSGIAISTAHVANSIPVAEYTVAQVVLSLKQMWRLSRQVHASKSFPSMRERESMGAYGSVVGLISLGVIGRMVAKRLQAFDVKVIACDPYVDLEVAARLGVELCALEDVFARANVVSCHLPWLKKTERMLTLRHFLSMKPGAVFINTARGAVVDEAGLINALRERPDIDALLDVTCPEPPGNDSLLYTLPNVTLSPHIAGSMGSECHRLGRAMVEELQRYLTNKPLKYAVSREC